MDRGLVITGLVSLVLTAVILQAIQPWLGRLGMIDTPGARSSHKTPVPRGGGLAIALAAAAAMLISGTLNSTSLVFIFGSTAFAALGFSDDLRSRSVKYRLIAQSIIGLASAISLAALWDAPALLVAALVPVLTFWIVGYVNAFNFMDGINGISAITAAVVGATHLALGIQIDSDVLATAGAVLLGGALGFMPFNFPRARVFAGDVGSYFLGGWIAIVSAIALGEGASIVAVAAPLILYLLDTSSTILRRARSGKQVWESHREHAYQHLANIRLDHTKTSSLVLLVTGTSAVLGLLANDQPPVIAAAFFVLAIAVSSTFVLLPLVLVDRRSVPREVS